ncbi:hypothetical protein [Paenibacillus ginsengihumi]|uniref:hypothetical protein n=1 Tax=Paenibacillus ginsengihumi TaxID=431596 RepID=UPI00037A8F48|nr:hypothetical protein [Paenibacillus ginsengihumi]
MERKYGLLMNMPEGKRAGYYAQIVKALASQAPPFDRDKELLVFSSPEERSAACRVMEQYGIPYEEMPLWLLPETAKLAPCFDDYGFVSRLERAYVYAELVSLFLLKAAEPGGGSAGCSDASSALLQLEEHMIAKFSPAGGDPLYIAGGAIETQHRELAEGIGKAYGCSIEWIE